MEFLVAAAFASVLGIAVTLWSKNADTRRTRRVLRRARVVPIAQLVDGELACVVGRVELDGPAITSMMEHRSCVAFDTTTRSFGEMTVSTRTLRQAVPFFIVDATGRARVDAPQVALCNRPAVRTDAYDERLLEVGALVRLVGSVVLDPTMQTTERAYREGQYKATLVGTAKFPLLADVDD